MAAAAPAAAANRAPGAPGQGRRRGPSLPGEGGLWPATGPGGPPFPRRRGQRAGTAAQLSVSGFFFAFAFNPRGSARLRGPAGADPPPEAGPGCRSRAIGRATGSATRSPLTAGAPDVLEETATRRGGRDPGTEAPLPGRLASQQAAGRHRNNTAAAAAAEGDAPLPPAAPRSPSRPTHTFAAQPPHRPSAACGRHPRGTRTEAGTGASPAGVHLGTHGATRPSHSLVR